MHANREKPAKRIAMAPVHTVVFTNLRCLTMLIAIQEVQIKLFRNSVCKEIGRIFVSLGKLAFTVNKKT
jgi:hypothetical protein